MRLLWLGRIVQVLLDFSFPLLLYHLVHFVEDPDATVWQGLGMAAGLLGAQALSVALDQNVSIGMQTVGLRIRSSLTTAIFRKVLLLRQDSLTSFSTGRLNNMITTDVDKARRVVRFIHILLLTAPARIAISIVALYKLVGVSVFISFGWMGVVILLNPAIMYVANKLEDRQQSMTDERVRKATEVISAIQVVKCYAWEEPATSRVEAARKAELLAMWRLYCLYTVMEGLWSSIVPVTTAVMFAAYSLLNPGSPLTPAQAFTAMSLLQMVQEPLFTLPWVLNLIVEALVAAKRLERLFFLPEAALPSTAALGSFCPRPPAAAADGGAAEDSAGEFRMVIDRTTGRALGASVNPQDGAALEVEAVTGDLFQQWNEDHPELAVRRGDLIVEVNGVRNHAHRLLEQCRQNQVLELVVRRSQELPAAAAGPGAAVRLEGASFLWQAGPRQQAGGEGDEDDEAAEGAPTTQFQLADVLLEVPSGALVAVVGATASGKTSLLQAILGEMPEAEPQTGQAHVRRERPIAFAPQQPWVFNATVRQNILFGEPFDERRYADCLRCCGLEEDLALLKAGDLTRVGEKGIALSGGQKARVCLARAAYRHGTSNLFLLDDPYSALDPHVAAQVHEEAVRKLLARKTRIVATNRLEFADSCDLVVVLENGRAIAVGRFDEVRASCAPLRALLAAQGLAGPGDALPPPLELDRAVSYDSALSGEGPAGGGGGAAEEHGAGGEGGGEDQEAEARATGQLKKEVIVYYLRKIGGPATVGSLAAMYIMSEVLNLALPIYLAKWTAAQPGPSELQSYLSVYVLLSLASIVFMTGRDMMGNVLGFRAARRLHAAMFTALLRAPMAFFQDTPQGRIINRLSKDVSEIDKELVWQLIYTVVPVLGVIGNFAMVGGIAYLSLIAFVPAFWLYFQLWKYYNKAALEIKRISKVQSSPVYDHFNNLCRENGISVVRAHCQVDQQCRTNNRLVVQQQRPEYSLLYVQLWFSMRIEHLGCLLVFLVAAFAVLERGRAVSAATAALALTFAGECSDSVQGLIGQISEVGMAFNCVERVMEYAETLAAEAPAVASRRPPPGWPTAGVLEVRNLQLRYRPGLPLVLRGLDFVAGAGEHIGVVGRTGAGKSSLLLALLRIVEPEQGSQVVLDGEDVLTLGLRDLRGGVAMIPQEPVLFQESLRYNCDPFGQHSDAQVWEALVEAQLAGWLQERLAAGADGAAASEGAGAASGSGSLGAPDGPPPLQPDEEAPRGAQPSEGALRDLLALEVKENGQNLSAGQRQMVAIARAVLRSSRLVLLDEATAAVDAATDAAIQLAVRRCFVGATTLTIAHRLQTILDSDRVLVLSQGEVAELGPPGELRERPGGIFRGMVEESGQH